MKALKLQGIYWRRGTFSKVCIVDDGGTFWYEYFVQILSDDEIRQHWKKHRRLWRHFSQDSQVVKWVEEGVQS